MARLVAVAREILRYVPDAAIADDEIAGLISDVLYDENDAWVGGCDGIITPRELAQLVVSHLESWLVDRTGQSWREKAAWDLDGLIFRLEQVLTNT